MTAIGLCVALGAIFLFSGYSKLLPVIETFEFTFVETGIGNWYSAPIFARLLIGLEFFTGILLLACFRLRKFTLPLTIGLLVFFIIYLALQIAFSGNSGNCGCFGEHLNMTPLQAIIKNLVMIAMAVGAYLLYPGWNTRRAGWVLGAAVVISVALPFIVNPIDYSYNSNNLDETVNYPLGIETLYHAEDTSKIQRPRVDLRKGKHVVAFLSLTCRHCRVAAKKFRLIKKNNPSLPVYFVLNGDRSRYDAFINDTRADNIPSSFCLGKTFVQLSSTRLPRIYYLDDGIVVKKVDYIELSQYDIEEWVNAP